MNATADTRPILITGGAGFIGCNIADRLAQQGHEILIYDALSRPGVERNLAWLKDRHGDRIVSLIADMRNIEMLRHAADEAKAVFHMAAQVAVTTSLADPREDFEINVGGTLNLLEALRARPDPPPLLFASTNKVYGDLTDIALSRTESGWLPADNSVRERGIGERRPLDFHTPYGCSKGAADQYVFDYARSFGLPAGVLRMSCIYGRRQMGTEDQGWVAHFLIRTLEGQPVTLYGDGHQVRDILEVDDAVDAYLAAWRSIDRVRGRAFNLGGGPRNAISLRRLLRQIEELTGREVEVNNADWRAGDQRYFVADTRLADATLGIGQKRPWTGGIARLAEWLANERRLTLKAQPVAQLAVAS